MLAKARALEEARRLEEAKRKAEEEARRKVKKPVHPYRLPFSLRVMVSI